MDESLPPPVRTLPDGRLVDDDVAAWLAAASVSADAEPARALTVEEMRAAAATWPWGRREPVHRVDDTVAAGAGRFVPVRVYRPDAAGGHGAIVFLHGGGWVVGGIDLVDGQCRHLANAVGVVVVNVEYRLAPEHPFPAALDDVMIVLRWLAGEGQALGADPSRLAVVGESAGGNLAAAAALRARDEHGPALLHQVLLAPVLDHDFDRPSMRASHPALGLTADAMRFFWDQYVPDERRRSHPYASPVRAHDIRGVAPATVVTAGLDPLCDEAVEYVERLRAAGVPADHVHHPGAIHGFTALADHLRSGREARDRVVANLRKALECRDSPTPLGDPSA